MQNELDLTKTKPSVYNIRFIMWIKCARKQVKGQEVMQGDVLNAETEFKRKPDTE